MTMSLQQIPFELWRTIPERQGIRSAFSPVFTRYIGVEHSDKYDDILRTLAERVHGDPEHAIAFDHTIPLTVDFDFINGIKAELANMDVRQIAREDITLFPDQELNQLYLNALQEVVLLALEQEKFLNASVQNNFICKLLIYSFQFIQNLRFEDTGLQTLKCLYYGEISRHDVYFLLLLSLLKFDVIYMNPLKEPEFFGEIDRWGRSQLHKNSQILPIHSWEERAAAGHVIEASRSVTLDLEEQISEELFSNSGIYKPWQFRDGTTKSLLVQASLIDLEQNWDVEARFRPGFKTEGKVVTVPNYFFEVEGESQPLDSYLNLLGKCLRSPQTLVFASKSGVLFDHSLREEEKYQLMFCQLSDGSFDVTEIMKLPFYPYAPYNDDTEFFILNKMNETIRDSHLFRQPIGRSKESILQFALLVLQMRKELVRLIDSFDFTGRVPKVVYFLEGEDHMEESHALLLGYLSKIGFDILVLSPAGQSDSHSFFNRGVFNLVRLDRIVYDQDLYVLERKSKKSSGFFSKLFQ